MTATSAIRDTAIRLRARAGYSLRLSSDDTLARCRRIADERLPRSLPLVQWSTSDNAFRLAVGGHPAVLSSWTTYFEEAVKALGHSPGPRTLRRVGRAELLRGVPAAGADLTLVCCPRSSAVRPRTASLVLPTRTHQVVRIDADFDTMMGRLHKTDRWRFAKNRRTGDWSWCQATSEADFDFFYHRMHVPTMRDRFGELATTEDVVTARECLFHQGRLFFLLARGQRIAGALCRWDPVHRTLRYRLNGLLDGDDAHRRAGALTAIYYFLIEWGCSHGVAAVDLSGSVPFLGRGIFQSKRRLHADVVVPPTPLRHLGVWLAAGADSPVVRDLLVANPVIAFDRHGELEAVYFHDGSRPARKDLKWESPGLARARYVSLDEFLGHAAFAAAAPEGGGDRG